MKNDIIYEVRKNRSEILESYDWDVEKMMRSMMERQGQAGHRVVSLEKKEPQQGVAPNAYPLRGQA